MEGATQLNKSHMVTLLQLTSWPMRGLPNSTAVLSLIDHLTNAQMKSLAKRTIVMCRYTRHNKNGMQSIALSIFLQ